MYIIRKIVYGLLVLWGVVTLVYFLFNLAPGDPVRNLVGENASEEVIANMRRKFALDLSVGHRYVLYLNDLSPLGIHSNLEQSRIYFNPSEYSGIRIALGGEGKAVYLKSPYLKRSFLTDKSVSSILAEVLPGTVVLAVVSIGLALNTASTSFIQLIHSTCNVCDNGTTGGTTSFSGGINTR